MKKEEIKIYPQPNEEYLLSYVHPFTNIKTRVLCKSKIEVDNLKDNLFKKYITCDPSSYDSHSTIEELIALFEARNPEIELMHSRRLKLDFLSMFSHFKLIDLKASSLNFWIEQVSKENSYSHRTIIRIRYELNKFYSFLIKEKIVNDSPIKEIDIKKPDSEPNRRVYLTQEEIETVCKEAKDQSSGYFYPLLKTAFETLFTSSELRSLSWEQVNFNNKTITIKNRSAKKISEELISLLKIKHPKDGVVFKNIYNKPFTKKMLSILINSFKKSSSIKKNWNIFDIRHSFAKTYLENGGDIRKLQIKLGHRSVDTTRQLYGMFELSSKILQTIDQ